MEDELPFTVGDYVFTDYLGSGSSGDVCLCHNSVTGELLAGKRVDLDCMVQDDFFRHFSNELRIHSKLRHPCIAELKDIVVDSQYVYVIMEYIDGGDLNAEVQEHGGLDEEQAKVYFCQIMSAIAHLHRSSIAHRDIKLENILITSDGRAKLSDFGLSRMQSIDGVMQTVCGTLVYTAPEIIGEGGHGVEVDIWSAGVLLYAMLACHFPWTLDGNLPDEQLFYETSRQIIDGYFEFPENFGLEVQDLIQKMMSVDPRERPTCCEILAHDWLAGYEEITSECDEVNTDLIELVEDTIEILQERRQSTQM